MQQNDAVKWQLGASEPSKVKCQNGLIQQLALDLLVKKNALPLVVEINVWKDSGLSNPVELHPRKIAQLCYIIRQLVRSLIMLVFLLTAKFTTNIRDGRACC